MPLMMRLREVILKVSSKMLPSKEVPGLCHNITQCYVAGNGESEAVAERLQTRDGLRISPIRALFGDYLGVLGLVTTMVPATMSERSWSISAESSALTRGARSWNGAIPTPPFSSVPMKGALSNVSSIEVLTI